MSSESTGMTPVVDLDIPSDDLTDDLTADIRLTAEAVSVTVGGELDVHTAPRLRDALRTVLDEGSPLLRVHLDGLAFVDSTGLGVLVGAWKAQRAAGGQLQVVCSDPRTLRLLQVTGLDRLLVVSPSDGATA